jgi:hypothetical protein
LELGIHETVMYGGPREIVHPAYLNPIIPYYFSDVMEVQKRNDNITVSLDGALYWPKGWQFYGQLVVDEYYYEREPYPNQTGYLLGFDWTKGFGWDRLWLTGEYVRVSRWVYNYGIDAYWNRLNYFNSQLGHPIGPDSDLIYFSADVLAFTGFIIRPQIRLQRQGETTIQTSLIVNNERYKNHPPFPYGIVERTQQIALEMVYSAHSSWRLECLLMQEQVRNQNHVLSSNSHRFSFQAKAVFDWPIISLFF